MFRLLTTFNETDSLEDPDPEFYKLFLIKDDFLAALSPLYYLMNKLSIEIKIILEIFNRLEIGSF